jgi:hypothetical protein
VGTRLVQANSQAFFAEISVIFKLVFCLFFIDLGLFVGVKNLSIFRRFCLKATLKNRFSPNIYSLLKFLSSEYQTDACGVFLATLNFDKLVKSRKLKSLPYYIAIIIK